VVRVSRRFAAIIMAFVHFWKVILATMVGATGKELLLWVYRHDNNTAQWQAMVDTARAHINHITEVSVCVHRVLVDGSFGYQTHPEGSTGRWMESWVPAFQSLGLRQTPLIDAGGASHVQTLLSDAGKQRDFINAAVANAKAKNYGGYNLDFEVRISSSYGQLFESFVDSFADALHETGMTLTLAVTGLCPPWYMGVSCPQLAKTRADRLYTMSTYKGDQGGYPFKQSLDTAVEAFGASKVGIGLQNGWPPLSSTELLSYASDQGVEAAAVWVMDSGSGLTESEWQGMNFWVTSSQALV